jgi:lysophospholipase L1-like esterase
MKKLWLALLLWVPLVAIAADNLGHAQWEPEISAYEAQDRVHPPEPGAVLFIGSSSIHFWSTLAQDLPEVRVLSRGFGGSHIDDSTYFVGRIVTPYKPRAILLYAGDNDLERGDTPVMVRDAFIAFVVRVRRDNPTVPIAFISIKPSVARQALMKQIIEANTLVKTWAATQKNVDYVDVFTPMLNASGGPRPELFIADGLHMKHDGYAIWISVLRPWLKAHPAPAGG